MENRVQLISLPELVIQLIVQRLSYEDLRNLRLVCKKLKVIVDQKTSRSLYLFMNNYLCERRLFHTGELVHHANTFHANKLTILKSIKFKSKFTGLRKLSIYYEKPITIIRLEIVDPNDLNCFQELVHLEVIGPALGNGELNLRNLEIAFISAVDRTSILRLHCPRLKALGLSCIYNPWLTSETRNSIRHFALEKRCNGKWLPFYGELKNLSTIAFTCAQDVTTFVLAVIERRLCLPSLKKIQLNKMFAYCEQMLRNLVKLKSAHETRHIEIRINWKTMAEDELTELLQLLPSIVPGNLTFFHNSLPSLFIGRLRGDLLRHFGEKPILHCLLPGVYDLILRSNEDVTSAKRLISKLDKLIGLTIGKELELDEQLFECILKTCRRIGVLRIENALIKQKQLDQMPKYLQNLNRLELEEDLSQSNFNLNFVTKFKNLSRIIFGFNIPKETTSFLLQNCTSGPNFHLQLHGKQSIFIFGQPRFEILRGSLSTRTYLNPSTKKTKFANIDDLFEHYYGQDLFNTPWEENIAPARQMNTNFRCSLI